MSSAANLDERELLFRKRLILNNLGAINLEGCGLNAFPKELLGMEDYRTGLTLLNLSNNSINSIPDDLSLCLPNLETLFLSNNRFTSLPSALGRCKKLFMLAFKSNQISHVPEDSLPISCGWLILTENKITALPTSIGRLALLQKCMLSSNLLTSLPLEMSNCKNLELIRLSNNRFTEIPSFLFQNCPRLSWFAFAENPALQGNMLAVANDIPLVDYAELEMGSILGIGASGQVLNAKWKGQAVAAKMYKGSATSDGLPKDELNAMIKIGHHPNTLSVLAILKNTPCDAPGLLIPLIPPSYTILGNPPTFKTISRDCYAEGTTFTLSRAKGILLEVALVMEHLHAQCITHGDLYAHNIMVDDRHLYLTDFGAAWDFSCLSSEVKGLVEAAEVCAFGWLVGELRDLCVDLSEARDVLAQLFDQCTCGQKPTFSQIASLLRSCM